MYCTPFTIYVMLWYVDIKVMFYWYCVRLKGASNFVHFIYMYKKVITDKLFVYIHTDILLNAPLLFLVQHQLSTVKKNLFILSFSKLWFIAVLLCSTAVRFASSVNIWCSVSASCGSCYSFATMGMLEARIRILTNNTETPILSPQQVVSCSEYSQGKLELNLKSSFLNNLVNTKIADMNLAVIRKCT